MLFEVCRLEDGKGCVKKLLEVCKSCQLNRCDVIVHLFKEINRTGIRKTDPRLSAMIKCLQYLKPESARSIEDMSLDAQTFKSVISENIVLINKASQNQMIIPAFEAFCENITEMFEVK